MKKKLKIIIFIALISFLMLACSLVYDTSINDDGSGNFTLEISFTQEELYTLLPLLSDLGGEMQSPQEICNSITEDIGPDQDVKVDFLSEGTNYTCLISFDFDDLDELIEIYEEMDVYVYDLRFDDEGLLIYDVEFDFSEEIDSSMEEYDIDLELEYIWKVTSPFSIIEHDADSISGTTLTKRIDTTGYTSLYFIAGASGIKELYSESTLDFYTDILDDESGMFKLNFLFDADQEEELLELLEDLDIGDEADDWCDEIGDQLEDLVGFPSGMDNEFVQEEAGEGFTCMNIFEFDDLDELEDLYKEFDFIDPDTLKIRDDVLEYEVVVDLALANKMGFDDLEADMEILWTVASPWPMGENDSDLQDGNIVSWEMKDGDDLEIVFNAEKSNLITILIIAGIFGIFVVIAIVAFLIIRSKKKIEAV